MRRVRCGVDAGRNALERAGRDGEAELLDVDDDEAAVVAEAFGGELLGRPGWEGLSERARLPYYRSARVAMLALQDHDEEGEDAARERHPSHPGF